MDLILDCIFIHTSSRSRMFIDVLLGKWEIFCLISNCAIGISLFCFAIVALFSVSCYVAVSVAVTNSMDLFVFYPRL